MHLPTAPDRAGAKCCKLNLAPSVGLQHTEEPKMRTLLELFNPADAGGTGTDTPPNGARTLTEQELDHIAGGGGKTGASTNPLED